MISAHPEALGNIHIPWYHDTIAIAATHVYKDSNVPRHRRENLVLYVTYI